MQLMPVAGGDPNERDFLETIGECTYNTNTQRPQFFAMLDAAALLWHSRAFFNAADGVRPSYAKEGEASEQHPWCVRMCEAFVHARERYIAEHKDSIYEGAVKTVPEQAFPAGGHKGLIGSLTDDEFGKYFPLLRKYHPIRDKLRRVRALDVVWGDIPYMFVNLQNRTTKPGAWMPLSYAAQCELYRHAGLIDSNLHIPANPWLRKSGLSCVFHQSYHSVYKPNDSGVFKLWLEQACKYQPPTHQQRPFSQYGGDLVEADFMMHRVECPREPYMERLKQLKHNRFGFTGAVRVGQQFCDGGLLQDLYNYEYRPFARVDSKTQISTAKAQRHFISNFMAYARTHSIIALASCQPGTNDISPARVTRNLYRLFVDTYDLMGHHPDDDGVPVVMGFYASPRHKPDDRAITFIAGTLSCVNGKLAAAEEAVQKEMRSAFKVQIPSYRFIYLNDATTLFERLLRAGRRDWMHNDNFRRARTLNKVPSRQVFDANLIKLQDAYIEFLQDLALGLIIEASNDKDKIMGLDLQALEPRQLEVDFEAEDENDLPHDSVGKHGPAGMASMAYAKDAKMTRKQLSILSLVPPNYRFIGTMRLRLDETPVDLSHLRRRIQQETIRKNKSTAQEFMERLLAAALATKRFESDGQDITKGMENMNIEDEFDTPEFLEADTPDALRRVKQMERIRNGQPPLPMPARRNPQTVAEETMNQIAVNQFDKGYASQPVGRRPTARVRTVEGLHGAELEEAKARAINDINDKIVAHPRTPVETLIRKSYNQSFANMLLNHFRPEVMRPR